MPTTIPVNASLGILRWSVAGDPEEQLCTMGFVGPPEDDAVAQAQALYEAATDTDSLTTVSAMNAPWTFVGVTVYKRLSGDPVVGEYVLPITQTAGSETALPTNCALLLKKNTARPGRMGRGRCFLPTALVDEASVDVNGTISATPYGILAARISNFYDEMVERELAPALFHADGSAGDLITSFGLDTRIATQRQRMRR